MPSAVLHPLVCGTSLNSLGIIFKKIICTCLGSYFSQKATTVGSPPNFSIHISQLCRIIEPQYFITLSLDSYWTYFWKHYIYITKKTPNLVDKILATKFVFFVPDCILVRRHLYISIFRWAPGSVFMMWILTPKKMVYILKWGPDR